MTPNVCGEKSCETERRNEVNESFSQSEHTQAAAATQVPPDGGYGWVVTISVALINGHSWGVSSAYAVFLAHFLENDIFENATKLQYALVGSLSVGCTLLVSPLITVAVREVGTRPVMLSGAILQSAGLVCASLSTKIWQLFLSQGVLFGLGMGMLFVPSYGLVSQWFDKRRALANGVAIAGAGLGGFTYSLSTGAMIRNLSLEWAYRVLCLVTLVVNVVCVLLIRTRYAAIDARQTAFEKSLLKKPEFLIILGFGFFSMLGYFVLIFTLANYANFIGLDSSKASWLPAIFMLGQAGGRPVLGWLSDSFGHILVASIMSLLTGVFALAIWSSAKSFGILIFFSVLEGCVAGVFWVTIAPVIAQVIGLKNLSSGLNILWVTLVLPSTFSVPIALEIVSGTGSYLGAQVFTGTAFIVASVCMACLYIWQVRRGNMRVLGSR